MTERPYTPETLAERWQIDAGTVRRMCRAGKLACFRVGTAYRITTAAVEAYEAAQWNIGSSGIAESGPSTPETNPAQSVNLSDFRRRKSIGRRLNASSTNISQKSEGSLADHEGTSPPTAA